MEKLKIGTLFSGGLAAIEWAMKYEELEHEVVFACEWDKYARKQYLAFHGEPSSCFYKDIREFDAKKYKGQIDMLHYGFPCQPFSLAGKRLGLEDPDRGNLFFEAARITKEIMPKHIIIENVYGLLSDDNGETIRVILRTLNNIGYKVNMNVVNAKEHGTAQNRSRIFIVCERKNYY